MLPVVSDDRIINSILSVVWFYTVTLGQVIILFTIVPVVMFLVLLDLLFGRYQ